MLGEKPLGSTCVDVTYDGTGGSNNGGSERFGDGGRGEYEGSWL